MNSKIRFMVSSKDLEAKKSREEEKEDYDGNHDNY